MTGNIEKMNVYFCGTDCILVIQTIIIILFKLNELGSMIE